jgi:hypothetical protein
VDRCKVPGGLFPALVDPQLHTLQPPLHILLDITRSVIGLGPEPLQLVVGGGEPLPEIFAKLVDALTHCDTSKSYIARYRSILGSTRFDTANREVN